MWLCMIEKERGKKTILFAKEWVGGWVGAAFKMKWKRKRKRRRRKLRFLFFFVLLFRFPRFLAAFAACRLGGCVRGSCNNNRFAALGDTAASTGRGALLLGIRVLI